MQCLLCGAVLVGRDEYLDVCDCPDCGAKYEYGDGTVLEEVPVDIKALIRRYLGTKAGNIDPAQHETRATHE